MKRIIFLGAMAGCVLFATLSNADMDPYQTDPKVLKKLDALTWQVTEMQKIIDVQNQKIEVLEGRVPSVRITPSAGETTSSDFKDQLKAHIGDSDKWLKDLKFSGDFRLRYEAFDSTSGHPSETDPRNRFRMRLRYGFEKKFNPDMKVGFHFATGGTADPTSTNESFDGNFVYKTHVIERAYAVYNPSWALKGPVEKLEAGGGKFTNPFERGSSPLVWDRDVRPEGAYETADIKLVDNSSLSLKGFGTLGQLILDEDTGSFSNADAELYGYQAGIDALLKGLTEKPIGFTSAFSFFDYSDYALASNFGAFARGNVNSDGDATQLDAGGFNVIENYNEVGFDFGNLPHLVLFFDWATNLDDTATTASLGGDNDAWSIGSKIGSAKKKGSWEVSYDYRWIEANSVVGAFNDSDFGDGHADKRGSAISAKYMLTDHLQFAAAAFFVNNLSSDLILRDEEQRRFQADLSWKF